MAGLNTSGGWRSKDAVFFSSDRHLVLPSTDLLITHSQLFLRSQLLYHDLIPCMISCPNMGMILQSACRLRVMLEP